jgi:hypothetical protein
MCAAGFVLAGVEVEAASVRPNHTEYATGEDITVYFSGGPGNSKDWVGVYPEGVVPGDVGSTRWAYVDGTQGGVSGLSEGSVTFGGGVGSVGTWKAYLLENDGYTVLAEATFTVVDATVAVLVRTDSTFYQPGKPITVSFSNGYGNAKDWIGVYPAGATPGSVDSLLWSYVDGTQSGNSGVVDGSVVFPGGLPEVGSYVVYFMINDSYGIDGTEEFEVVEPPAIPRLLTVVPSNGSVGNPPVVKFSAVLTNGISSVDVASVGLKLDGVDVVAGIRQENGATFIGYTNAGLFASGSTHRFDLVYSDDAVPVVDYAEVVEFTVGDYRNVVLPEPLYFEDFDGVAEGGLPAGWTEESFTEIVNPLFNLGNLDSASYATWVVVGVDRFAGELEGYSDGNLMTDYQRVLTPNSLNVVNGVVLEGPLASGQMVFSDSGYRQGQSQVMYLYTPDYDLSGQTDVHVSYHSLWEQNQDSMGAVEYSIDGGVSWLPVVYMLDGPDVVLDLDGNVDAEATFNADHADVAFYFDPDLGGEIGGRYGDFIAAPISAALAPYISVRVNDDAAESKRVELFRLDEADSQSRVRFRFAHAGTDSWYFGVDDFGLYSIPPVADAPVLSTGVTGGSITLSWPAEAVGYVLEVSSDLGGTVWQAVDTQGANSYTVTPEGVAGFYRLRQ